MSNTEIDPGPGRLWGRLRRLLLASEQDTAAVDRALAEAMARQPAPVLWLLGAAQAGKTSLIRALTGAERAEIGNGFRPCTRTASLYDFPPEQPTVRFLDTRGLGEVGYDPAEDIAQCEARAHQLIAVVKLLDDRPEGLLKALKEIRRRQPEWPLLVVQTCLHEAYASPETPHIEPYPFSEPDWAERVPEPLARRIEAQRAILSDLPGRAEVRFVAVDLTLPEDGFEPPDYGLEALWECLEDVAALGLAARLRRDQGLKDAYSRRAQPLVVSHSLAAAGAGALPLVDLALVTSIQAHLLRRLGALYGVDWTRRRISQFFGLLGIGLALGVGLSMGGRSLLKLIPGFGQTAGAVWGAAACAAVTYALGASAVHYLRAESAGRRIEAEDLRATWKAALAEGRDLIRRGR